MSSQLLASCPKCGSTNVVRHISGELECLSCGYKWREGRRYGHPRTEEERRERHKERYGTEELPPRGRRFREEERDFYDAILGWCTYDRDSFYLTNELYGGYNYTCEKGSGAAQYVAPEKVLELAEKIGVEKIHLAGEAWKEIGHEGFGEEVSLEDAKRLLKELKEKRGGVKPKPKKWRVWFTTPRGFEMFIKVEAETRKEAIEKASDEAPLGSKLRYAKEEEE